MLNIEQNQKCKFFLNLYEILNIIFLDLSDIFLLTYIPIMIMSVINVWSQCRYYIDEVFESDMNGFV